MDDPLPPQITISNEQDTMLALHHCCMTFSYFKVFRLVTDTVDGQ